MNQETTVAYLTASTLIGVGIVFGLTAAFIYGIRVLQFIRRGFRADEAVYQAKMDRVRAEGRIELLEAELADKNSALRALATKAERPRRDIVTISSGPCLSQGMIAIHGGRDGPNGEPGEEVVFTKDAILVGTELEIRGPVSIEAGVTVRFDPKHSLSDYASPIGIPPVFPKQCSRCLCLGQCSCPTVEITCSDQTGTEKF